uniref:Uncharacterized protein n=1 Tax=viral metagenome TaxID=1070528 RepID=A0A6M3LDY7_9ZZZZ
MIASEEAKRKLNSKKMIKKQEDAEKRIYEECIDFRICPYCGEDIDTISLYCIKCDRQLIYQRKLR